MALSFSYPDLTAHPDFDNHEKVLLAVDPDIDFKAYISIHSTQLGPARGGCRYWTRYADDREAIKDGLRLSRGMTFKNTLAGLPHGGGKTVIIGSPDQSRPTREIMHALGHALNELGGIYETGEDVGTSPSDFKVASEVTRHVRVKDESGGEVEGLAGGDPSPYTAYGIYCGIRASVKHRLGRESLKDVRFAIKGLGHVSQPLCERLYADGARLWVCDLDAKKVQMAVQKWNAVPVAPEDIMRQDVEVYSPCALGGDINDDNLHDFKAVIVAGAANNQLATPAHAQILHERGILYAPDYAINAGGVINVVLAGQPYDLVMERVGEIGTTLSNIYERSKSENKNTALVADTVVIERLERDRLEKSGSVAAAE